MFHIILYQPEIPPNTGNIIRLCANTGCSLSLIKPLGFALEDRKLQRAGLDYHEWAKVNLYDSLDQCLDALKPRIIYPCSTKGKTTYCEPNFSQNDAFLFGPETRGLPTSLLQSFNANHILKIPMMPNSRSINLANAVSIIVYEALRQNQFNFIE